MTKNKLFNQKISSGSRLIQSGTITRTKRALPVNKLIKGAALIVIWVTATYFSLLVTNTFIADNLYSKGTSTGSLDSLREAIKLNPSEEAYHRNLGLAFSVIAKDEEDESLRREFSTLAEAEFIKAVQLNDRNLLTLKSVLAGYQELGDIDQRYLSKALELAIKLTVLTPTDPSIWYNAAKIESTLGNRQKATEYYQKTLSLKNDPTVFPLVQ